MHDFKISYGIIPGISIFFVFFFYFLVCSFFSYCFLFFIFISFSCFLLFSFLSFILPFLLSLAMLFKKIQTGNRMLEESLPFYRLLKHPVFWFTSLFWRQSVRSHFVNYQYTVQHLWNLKKKNYLEFLLRYFPPNSKCLPRDSKCSKHASSYILRLFAPNLVNNSKMVLKHVKMTAFTFGK